MANKQYPVPNASTPGSSGGGGTVTSVSGTTNQIAVANGSTTPVISVPSTFIAPGSVEATSTVTADTTVTSGKNGGTAGQLILNGSTSGSATITAPAVAGTVTNPITISNGIGVPVGTAAAPSIAFTGSINNVSGFNAMTGQGGIYVNLNGTSYNAFNQGFNGQFLAVSGGGFSWTNGVIGGATDLTLSRAAANILAVGTGVVGNIAGSIQCSSIALNGAVASPTAGVYYSGTTAGVSAGSFSAITAITTVGGIVTQLTGSSDERLKNSSPYAGGLTEILAIDPVRYTWNEKGQEHTGLSGDREYVGFTAQNVQQAIPEAITATEPSKDGTEEYLSFDDRPVLAALVNAVKELTARVKELESQNERIS